MAEAGYRVTGRVQGVGFRWWTRSLATRLGLSGSVRNEPDGSVTVHVRGTDAALRELEQLLRQGPPGARVAGVSQVPFTAIPRDDEFVIAH